MLNKEKIDSLLSIEEVYVCPHCEHKDLEDNFTCNNPFEVFFTCPKCKKYS